jgi:predicted metalloprotease
MKFGSDDDADSSQVEDRRGMDGGGGGGGGGRLVFGGGGLGLVGVIAYVLLKVLTGDAVVVDDAPSSPRSRQSAPSSSSSSAPSSRGAQLGGSCEGVTSQSDPAKFISCVVSNVQKFWSHELDKQGQHYQPAHLVLFSEATRSGCGTASAATGPFYCPGDGKVYLDLGFFHELSARFHARGGDFAQAYVVAHEYGHHVQDLLGLERRARLAGRDPSARNAASVRLELQADCYAGVWGHAAYEHGTVSAKEVAQALDAAAAVGDDRIQEATAGRVRPETFTHGSAAERQHWFGVGMQGGDPRACDPP